MPSCIDLHMHSTASDGTDTPTQLVEKMLTRNIQTFAMTDHDTILGVEQVNEQLPENTTFIPGVEFSCRMLSGKCHILGYGYDANHPAFQAVLAEGTNLRQAKLDVRLSFLQERGIVFPDEELSKLHQLPSVGKPHLANLMVKFGYAGSIKEAIDDTLNLCHTSSSRVSAETAVRAIAAAGGIPVWAHPLGGTGEKEIGKDQFSLMLKELIGYGLKGLECFYSKYPMASCEKLADVAREKSLLISGGSDYHGKNKNIEPGTLNAENIVIQPERLTILNHLRIGA